MTDKQGEWFIYGERLNGAEWFVVEGPTTEALAKLKAQELNGRDVPADAEQGEDGSHYYWASTPAAITAKVKEVTGLADLTPADVIAMPVKEFKERFGFMPADKLEKYLFAITAARLNPMLREAIEAEIAGPKPDLSRVVW